MRRIQQTLGYKNFATVDVI